MSGLGGKALFAEYHASQSISSGYHMRPPLRPTRLLLFLRPSRVGKPEPSSVWAAPSTQQALDWALLVTSQRSALHSLQTSSAIFSFC